MSKNTKLTHPQRGEIWLVNFDPTIGVEIRKTRPALILQNEIANPSLTEECGHEICAGYSKDARAIAEFCEVLLGSSE